LATLTHTNTINCLHPYKHNSVFGYMNPQQYISYLAILTLSNT